MKNNKELEELLHPEREITKWIRLKFWILNLDLKFADSFGKTKRFILKHFKMNK